VVRHLSLRFGSRFAGVVRMVVKNGRMVWGVMEMWVLVREEMDWRRVASLSFTSVDESSSCSSCCAAMMMLGSLATNPASTINALFLQQKLMKVVYIMLALYIYMVILIGSHNIVILVI